MGAINFFFLPKFKNEKDSLNLIQNANSFYGLFTLFHFQLGFFFLKNSFHFHCGGEPSLGGNERFISVSQMGLSVSLNLSP
jgi:hypothetical protein